MGAELEPDDAEQTPPIPRLCRYLSERSPQPMVAVEGMTHVVSYLNPAFARLVGREQKDLVGRPFAEAVPEGDGNGCLVLLDRVFRTGYRRTWPSRNTATRNHDPFTGRTRCGRSSGRTRGPRAS